MHKKGTIMQISNLSTQSFGQNKKANNNQQTSANNKTMTITRNALIAGLTGLLTGCASDTFTLTTGPQGEAMLPLSTIMPGATSKERRDIVSIIDDQPSEVISDLSNEVCLIRHFSPTDGANGYYSRPTETLNVNDTSFLHELMHAVDNYDNNGVTSKNFSNRPEYRKAVAQEMKAFEGSNLDFRSADGIPIIINSPQEVFAECGAYIVSGGDYDENAEIFDTYFPQTMALTKQYINEARRMPKHRRMSYTATAHNQANGTRVYTFNDGRGQKRVEETFAPSLWPYRYAPNMITYDANGNKTKEVTTRYNREGMPVERTTWTSGNGTKTEPIMTEATRQAHELVEILRAAERANNQ